MKISSLFFILAFMQAVISSQVHADSWEKLPSEFFGGQDLDTSEWSFVDGDAISRSEELLKDSSFVKIPWSLAASLTGGRISPKSDKNAFLLRAFDLKLTPVQNDVYVGISMNDNGHLLVETGATTSSYPSPIRHPVVAVLSRAPTEVYVTYSVAR
jgi:hypothetical protein